MSEQAPRRGWLVRLAQPREVMELWVNGQRIGSLSVNKTTRLAFHREHAGVELRWPSFAPKQETTHG